MCFTLIIIGASIQLDESTLPYNKALLLAYVRLVKEEFAKNLITHIKGESIFYSLEEFFKEK